MWEEVKDVCCLPQLCSLSEADLDCCEKIFAEPAIGGREQVLGLSGLEVNTDVFLLAWGFAKDF